MARDYADILPPNGALIRFTKTPLCSWSTPGEPYRVSYHPHTRAGRKGIHSTTSVWLERDGASTFDPAAYYHGAAWDLVEEH